MQKKKRVHRNPFLARATLIIYCRRAPRNGSKVEHFMHMSAQFSKSIDISQTNRSFVVTLHAKGYTPRIVSLAGAQMYEAFLQRCQE